MLYNEIVTGQKNLSLQAEILQQKIQSLPEGELHCIKNGIYTKWYHAKDHDYVYIPKKNRPLAEALALKKFYQLQLKELTARLRLLDSSIQLFQNPQSNALFTNHIPFRYEAALVFQDVRFYPIIS